jgi:hypothetical protein
MTGLAEEHDENLVTTECPWAEIRNWNVIDRKQQC